MPFRGWGVAGGLLLIATIAPLEPLNAAQEQVVRVLVLDSTQIRFRADGNKPLLVIGIGPNQRRVSTLKIRRINGRFSLAMNGSSSRWLYLPSNRQLRIKSKDPRGIWLGKRRYFGDLGVFVVGGRLKVVNYIGVERYLVSVVGSEMPKSWPMAALKAQAVAARTYALQQVGRNGFYDINSTEANQVYLGIESETESTRKAVASTRSLVLTHKGKLINAVFHSSSGGATEASGLVWKRQMPYLVSVPDHDQHSPFSDWQVKFDPKQLKAAFSGVGGVKNIQVLRSTKTGRVLDVRVVGSRGELELTGQELRRRLGLKSTLVSFEMIADKSIANKKPSNTSSLVSAWFESSSNRRKTSLFARRNRSSSQNGSHQSDKALASSTSFPLLNAYSVPPPPLLVLKMPPSIPSSDLVKKNILLVKGSGSGHGVGMSQWGAYGLAMKGVNFRRILTYYYKGVAIRRL